MAEMTPMNLEALVPAVLITALVVVVYLIYLESRS